MVKNNFYESLKKFIKHFAEIFQGAPLNTLGHKTREPIGFHKNVVAYQQTRCSRGSSINSLVINRPGVAGAVLQSASSLIN